MYLASVALEFIVYNTLLMKIESFKFLRRLLDSIFGAKYQGYSHSHQNFIFSELGYSCRWFYTKSACFSLLKSLHSFVVTKKSVFSSRANTKNVSLWVFCESTELKVRKKFIYVWSHTLCHKNRETTIFVALFVLKLSVWFSAVCNESSNWVMEDL